VQDYYQQFHNDNIDPEALGVLLTPPNAPKVIVPIQRCRIEPGQFYKKKLDPSMTSIAVRFATKKPRDRLDAIRRSADGPVDFVANSKKYYLTFCLASPISQLGIFSTGRHECSSGPCQH
jgi:hypothetical protein